MFRFVLYVHLALLWRFLEIRREGHSIKSKGRLVVMSRNPAMFKQADIRRAWAAARRDGKEVVRTEIGPDGRIVLVHKPDAALAPADAAFEAWKAKRDAHPA
jgi:hypothetical protein